MLYTVRFFSSKCSLFHNANFFGSCIIHILYTVCAEIKKKKIRRQRVKHVGCLIDGQTYLLIRALLLLHIFQRKQKGRKCINSEKLYGIPI